MLRSEMGQICVVEEAAAAAAAGTCQRRTGNSFPARAWKEKERAAEGRVAARSGRSPPRQQSLSSTNSLILERLERHWSFLGDKFGRKSQGLITPA